MASERRLVGELETAKSVLKDSSFESYYLQSGEDPWHRDLESLKQDLTNLETESYSPK